VASRQQLQPFVDRWINGFPQFLLDRLIHTMETSILSLSLFDGKSLHFKWVQALVSQDQVYSFSGAHH